MISFSGIVGRYDTRFGFDWGYGRVGDLNMMSIRLDFVVKLRFFRYVWIDSFIPRLMERFDFRDLRRFDVVDVFGDGGDD